VAANEIVVELETCPLDDEEGGGEHGSAKRAHERAPYKEPFINSKRAPFHTQKSPISHLKEPICKDEDSGRGEHGSATRALYNEPYIKNPK